MQIILNGKEKIFDKQISVAELVNSLGIDKRKIAFERNLEIIPRSQYEDTVLYDGDRIEIIHFIGGG